MHPPVQLPLPRLERASDTESEHSEDSAGEKEAKRQRSEPTTPVSTSSRHPYDYDALMGITRVGTKEAEGFEEDLDSAEYHDATEEPVKREDIDGTQAMLKSAGFQGGIGSSSLKECIELLNATVRNSPAPLVPRSGVRSCLADLNCATKTSVLAQLGQISLADFAPTGHFWPICLTGFSLFFADFSWFWPRTRRNSVTKLENSYLTARLMPHDS